MRMLPIVTCAILSATMVAAAQSATAQTPEPIQRGLALSSCTPIADATANRFTISKPRSAKSWYRTAGPFLLQSGQRVHVTGRLIPSPNIAGQAGALDPTVPAMAMASGDAFRRPVGVVRKPTVGLATHPLGVRVDCAVR